MNENQEIPELDFESTGLAEMFRLQYEEAVDQLDVGEDGEDFQEQLELMVARLQRAAYASGWEDRTNWDSEHITLELSSDESNRIVRTMLYGGKLVLGLTGRQA